MEIKRLCEETGLRKSNIILNRGARYCPHGCGYWTMKRSTMSSHVSRMVCRKTEESIRVHLLKYKPNVGLLSFVNKNMPSLKNEVTRASKAAIENTELMLEAQKAVIKQNSVEEKTEVTNGANIRLDSTQFDSSEGEETRDPLFDDSTEE